MNNIDNNSPVEQLWYTWSDVGLSTIHAGFRIRAASSGLTEIYSDRVKSVEGTMRYVLPPGTDRFAITPDQAPVGLTFMRSEWNNEYLLVHKKYTGADGVGRLGNFFIHALALGTQHSQDFSTEDAIWLWESPLWKTDSKELEAKDRRSTQLDALSIEKVYNSAINFRSAHFQQVQNALQFIIAAYLMRRDRCAQLYIAAPAGQEAKIASIIAGLTNCLPAQLLVNLTFSTYEPNIAKATTEIVGTSWIAATDAATTIFPQHFYLEKLAVNCTTHEKSKLQAHPQIVYNQLAADFAEFAAESLATGKVDQLYTLRNDAERIGNLDSALFLQIYSELANPDGIGDVEIEKYLNSDIRIDWLCRKGSRKKILDRVIANPAWGSKRLYDLLLILRAQAQKEIQNARRIGTSQLSGESEPVASISASDIRPRRKKQRGTTQAKKVEATLADALALLAKNTISEVVKRMEQASKLVGNMTPDRLAERQKLVDTITVLLRLMDGCLLPQDPTEVWRQLFEVIVDNNKAITFLLSNWTIHAWLLKNWNQVFLPDAQDDIRMHPLLIISWDHLGEFLKLGLRDRHKQWIISAIQELVPTPISSRQIVLDLGQNYTREIGNLLAILAKENHYNTEAYLITRLVEQGYPLSSDVRLHIEPLLEQLNRDNTLRRSAKDLTLVLTRAGYSGTPLYQKLVAEITMNTFKTTRVAGEELIDALIKYEFPLRNWIIDLLLTSNSSLTDVLQVIPYVYSTPASQHTFFIQNASLYLSNGSLSFPREYWIQPMLAVYQHLLTFDGKLERLFILLESSSYDQETISQLLTNPPLEEYEMERFLTRYGASYLQSFQQSPKLASIVVANFKQLIKAGHRNDLLFKIMPAQTGERYLALLLSAANLTLPQQIDFLERYGTHYLTLYPTMPPLLEYIDTYMKNFQIEFLEKEGTKAFFVFLVQARKHLALDPATQQHIKCWKIIDDYFTLPTTDPQMLEWLAQALNFLSLPNSPQFVEKLVKAFLSCIQTDSNLFEIIHCMRGATKVARDKSSEYQFLYALAQQAASIYERNKNFRMLLPYLSFAINMPQSERTEHFVHLFLDTLFWNIDVLDLNSWIILDTSIKNMGLQSGSIQRWNIYLKWLGILDQLNPELAANSGSADKKNLLPQLKLPKIHLPQLKIGKTKNTPPDANGGGSIPPSQLNHGSGPQSYISPGNSSPPISSASSSDSHTTYQSYQNESSKGKK